MWKSMSLLLQSLRKSLHCPLCKLMMLLLSVYRFHSFYVSYLTLCKVASIPYPFRYADRSRWSCAHSTRSSSELHSHHMLARIVAIHPRYRRLVTDRVLLNRLALSRSCRACCRYCCGFCACVFDHVAESKRRRLAALRCCYRPCQS